MQIYMEQMFKIVNKNKQICLNWLTIKNVHPNSNPSIVTKGFWEGNMTANGHWTSSIYMSTLLKMR